MARKTAHSVIEYVSPGALFLLRVIPQAQRTPRKSFAMKTYHTVQPQPKSGNTDSEYVVRRRRRSKMNDEFATLKDMIPACKDQEMHKLAILSVGVFLSYTG